MATLLRDADHDSLSTQLAQTILLKKSAVQASTVELEDDSDSDFKKSISIANVKVDYDSNASLNCFEPPTATRIDKLREVARVAATRTNAILKQNKKQYCPLSAQGKYIHDLVMPYNTWWGKNRRVAVGQCLSSVSMQDVSSSPIQAINCAAHNYAGTYDLEPRLEELHRLALDRLPVANAAAVPLLAAAANGALADFVAADFCVSTTTGYASNYVALPALIDGKTLVILDEFSHNSMFTGTYLGQPGAIRKVPHNDASRMEEILRETRGKFSRTILVFEGLYSMEADTPPLGEIRRLKATYDLILFCDEAHSMCSTGSNGRGCVERWNDKHPGNPLPLNFIDVRTGTYSKAIGGVGGFICGKAEFEGSIRTSLNKIHIEDESVSSAQLVQCLWVLSQPTRLTQNLLRLRAIARFCREELSRSGIYIYGDDDGIILPIHCGRPSVTAKLSYLLRKKGLLGTAIIAPAVPVWQTRVRLCLSASHTDQEVDRMIDAIVSGCAELGICKRSAMSRRKFHHVANSHSQQQAELEAQETSESIRSLINQSADRIALEAQTQPRQIAPKVTRKTIQCGHDARTDYGLCCGASRWGLSSETHVAVEELVSKQISSEACLTYPGSSIGLASTIAALSRPLLGYHTHHMLLPEGAPQPVEDGTIIASPKGRPKVVHYRDLEHLHDLQIELSRGGKKIYFTIYAFLPSAEAAADILGALSQLVKDKSSSAGMTILLHSPTHIPSASQLEQVKGSRDVEVLVCGSFHKTLGLSGGYLAGSQRLIEELRFTNRGYMFTSSPQPFLMGMVKAALEARFEEKDE